MPNNNLRAKVRERLAYVFSGALVGELFFILGAKVAGFEIAVPEAIGISAIMGTIIAFYFAGEYSREKPEG